MKRLECLDGLRGFLAVYVLLGHMAPFAALPEWVQIGLSHGGAAVDMFFMLSGLVITQSLLHADCRATPFLIARAARIFPVFLVVFALAVTIQPLSCGFGHMPWIDPDGAARSICVAEWPHTWLPEITAHLTMMHGLIPNGVLPHAWVSFLGSAWSLSTEWQFYLVALLTGHQSRRLGWILLILAAAGVGWHLVVPDTWQFSRAFLPNKGHFFALGVASVAVVRRDTGALFRYAIFLAGCLAVCAAQGSIGKMVPPLAWTFCLAVQMRPTAHGLSLVNGFLRSREAKYLGAISYCLYLVNEPIHKIASTILSWFADGDSTRFTLMWIPAAIGLPLLAAAGLHRYLEAPALRWGRSLAKRSIKDRTSVPGQVHEPAL
jgi:peptidoglycan/LPS O-acetylase OafA/YrhL